MALDPNIILSGKIANPLEAMSRGMEVGEAQNVLRRRDALEQAYQQHGEGALAGNPESLNALARLGDFKNATSIQAHRQDMAFNREEMEFKRAKARRDAADWAKTASEEEAARAEESLSRLLMGAAPFYERGDEAGYNAYLQQNGIDPAQIPFGDFISHAARAKGTLEGIKEVRELMAGPKAQSAQGKFYTDQAAGLVPSDAEFKAGGTTVNLGKGETEFDKNMGKNMAEKATSMLDAGMQAPGKIAQYEQMKGALSQTYTGAGGETLLTLRRAAQALGMDVGDISNAELAQSIGNRVALELRNPAGGAGMPGAMSDKDREFLLSSVPNLSKTPEGNLKLLDMLIQVERRSQEVSQRARDYMSRNGGRIDYLFFDELAQWSAQNPLFANDTATPASQSDPQGAGTTVEIDGTTYRVQRVD